MSLLTLGNVALDGFEVPSRVEFGGKQRLAVHTLIGGARVIDVLGRDDAPLRWRGVLSGAGAGDRARTLDAMRVAGSLQSLTWDAFCYIVVISELKLSFCNSWWIPYEIVCTVQQDLAQSSTISSLTLAASVVDDLAAAIQLLNPSEASDVEAISSLISFGQQSTVSSISGVQFAVTQDIADAETDLACADIAEVGSSAGWLGQLCLAQGFLCGSLANVDGTGS